MGGRGGGGDKGLESHRFKQRDMGLPAFSGVTITAKYFPSVMNTQAEFQSRQGKDPLDWKLNFQVFLIICQIFGKPEIDLVAFCLSHQVPPFIAWMPDLFSQGTGAMQ